DNAQSSNATLEALRHDVIEYRETFVSTRDQNLSQIRTLQSQLDAPGFKPGTGSEPGNIAQLRQQLTAQLDTLQVSRIAGEEAYFRANGLIIEVNRILHGR